MFAEKFITDDIIREIAVKKIKQAHSKLWHAMHQGRVTGSKIFEAVHCKTEGGALVQSILGGYKVSETKAIKRGQELEKKVIKELEIEFGIIERTALILISPFIGVSPDGLTENFVVEVKCPFSLKTMKNYIGGSQIREKYKAQIMVQKSQKDSCIGDPSFEQSKIKHKYWIHYDKEYENLLNSAEHFWKHYIFKIF